MKKIYLFILMIMAVTATEAQFTLEPFNYSPHATNGIGQQSNSAWVRLNTGDSMLIGTGNLSYSGLPASTGNKVVFDGGGSDNARTFTSTAITTGSAYYSFILNITSLGTLNNTTGGYFTSLLQDGSTTAFAAPVWARASATAGKYNIGISTRSAAASVVSWLPNELDPGTSYFIVASYEIISGAGNDVGKIWLNPVLGGSEPAANATAAPQTDLTTAGVSGVLLRQDNTTNTPFVEMDELRAGATWTSVTPSAAVPTLTATALTAFANTCTNTTAGPNSFTITGTNLSAVNVTVGPLAGFTFSTTAGGTYTASLNESHPAGSYSQQVFVKFTPTAVQSYNGNIPVGGGGAPSFNVAASGAGVNTVPTVTTGGTSAITQTTADAAGSIIADGCTAITAYGIEYSTSAAFPNGTGTAVPSTNLSGGNFTSNLSGLSPATTYYYHAYATNGGGTGYGSEQSFTTASFTPTLTASALTGFGNVCINTTAGPNSFTITGTNLTNANVDVAALAGFTYSTTSGGTYTTTLSLTQPGGPYSQQIFVRFNPTAVQSYNGNIVVSGGGAPNINVAATGAGVNTAPSVTTGGSSAVTQVSATAAGSITATGCSAVTAYGIERSTTNGFANGSGTQVASSNLSGGNFSSNLTGLSPSTTYYYKAYATNSSNTTYGAQQSFTTASPVLSATALTPFGSVCINTTAGPNSFTITSAGLSAANVTVGALAGFTYSTTSGGTYTNTLSLTQPGGPYSQQIFVKFSPTAVQSYSGNIPVGGGGAATVNVAASGDGVNTLSTVITGAASNINNNSATLAGSIAANGCSNVTAYGIEYSGINGFTNGSGTQVPSTNLTGGSFSSSISGLVQGTTYYYKAYAVSSGGTSYGLQQSFTAASVANGFTIYPVPASPGSTIRVTMNNLAPGYYGILFLNSDGRLVYQKDLNIQGNFINQTLTIPGHLPAGIYRIQLVNHLDILSTKNVLIQ